MTPTKELSEAEKQWLADGAEATLRLEYPLTPESVVFDVGGHLGKFTADLLAKGQNPYVHIFEPVAAFAAECRRRFAGNPKVTVHEYGLYRATRVANIFVDGECSSLYVGLTRTEEIELRDVAEIMRDFPEVALLSVNIEGAEYAFLQRIIDAGLGARFRDIQVQFHEFYFRARQVREMLRKQLRLTHTERYCYPFVWESWRRT